MASGERSEWCVTTRVSSARLEQFPGAPQRVAERLIVRFGRGGVDERSQRLAECVLAHGSVEVVLVLVFAGHRMLLIWCAAS